MDSRKLLPAQGRHVVVAALSHTPSSSTPSPSSSPSSSSSSTFRVVLPDGTARCFLAPSLTAAEVLAAHPGHILSLSLSRPLRLPPETVLLRWNTYYLHPCTGGRALSIDTQHERKSLRALHRMKALSMQFPLSSRVGSARGWSGPPGAPSRTLATMGAAGDGDAVPVGLQLGRRPNLDAVQVCSSCRVRRPVVVQPVPRQSSADGAPEVRAQPQGKPSLGMALPLECQCRTAPDERAEQRDKGAHEGTPNGGQEEPAAVSASAVSRRGSQGAPEASRPPTGLPTAPQEKQKAPAAGSGRQANREAPSMTKQRGQALEGLGCPLAASPRERSAPGAPSSDVEHVHKDDHVLCGGCQKLCQTSTRECASCLESRRTPRSKGSGSRWQARRRADRSWRQESLDCDTIAPALAEKLTLQVFDKRQGLAAGEDEGGREEQCRSSQPRTTAASRLLSQRLRARGTLLREKFLVREHKRNPVPSRFKRNPRGAGKGLLAVPEVDWDEKPPSMSCIDFRHLDQAAFTELEGFSLAGNSCDGAASALLEASSATEHGLAKPSLPEKTTVPSANAVDWGSLPSPLQSLRTSQLDNLVQQALIMMDS